MFKDTEHVDLINDPVMMRMLSLITILMPRNRISLLASFIQIHTFSVVLLERVVILVLIRLMTF